MNCDFNNPTMTCGLCGTKARTVDTQANCRMRPRIIAIIPTEGPGRELEKLLKAKGANPDDACGCEYLRDEMNRLGVDGCRGQFDNLSERLRQTIKKTGWGQWFKVAASSVAQLDFYNPADPAPGLIREAIRRAATSTEASGS